MTADGHGILAPFIPLPVWWLFGLAAIAAYCALYRIRTARDSRVLRVLFFALGAGTVGAAMWIVFGLLACVLTVDPSWAGWPLALASGAAIDAVVALYGRERNAVPQKQAWTLTGLRIALVVLVALMLIQPAREQTTVQTYERYVAVAVDVSASMALQDEYTVALDKLEIARLFDPENVPNLPEGFAGTVGRMNALIDKLEAQIAWLEYIGTVDFATRRHQLGRKRNELKSLFGEVLGMAHEEMQRTDTLKQEFPSAYSGATQEISVVRAMFKDQLEAKAASSLKYIEETAGDQFARDPRPIIDGARIVQTHLRQLVEALAPLTSKMTESFYSALSDDDKQRVESCLQRSRMSVARSVLAGNEDAEREGLLDVLTAKYAVRAYTFGAHARATNLASGVEGAFNEPLITEALEKLPGDALQTDLAALLNKVQEDIPSRLSGVVLVTDGRNTSGEDPEAEAWRLHSQNVPVCAVALGSLQSPLDAAVVTVAGPDTVVEGNKFSLRAGVKFEQVTQETARVTLELDEEVVDEETLTVLSSSYRTTVQFTHTPTNKGVNVYNVRVAAIEGEQLQGNNVMSFGVSVTDARSKMLVIDGRPRWEARYLRNLFAGRDSTVQLQYLLMYPDKLAGAPVSPPVHASVDRPPEEVEATALPESPAEWNKFDLVILGDVARKDLGDEAVEAIRDYVAERGGTLVLIAGPEHMPEEYVESPLEAMFPMTFTGQPPQPDGTNVPDFFSMRLTDEGAGHVLTRLHESPKANRDIWAEFPEVDWRYPVNESKDGATVLVFASTEDDAEQVPVSTNEVAPEAVEAAHLKRRDLQRNNALIAVQRYGAGKVLMLAFDRTWRMRYRVGDKHHHRFWAQVLRWAMEDNLPVGTRHVRMGTDRVQYRADQSITANAKITDVTGNPVETDEAGVEIRQGTNTIVRGKLDPVPGVAGRYEITFDPVEAGSYRVVLTGDEVQDLLARDGHQEELGMDILVVVNAGIELAELAADTAVVNRLAEITDGDIARPSDALSVMDRLGPGIEKTEEIDRFTLWNSWGLLIVIWIVAGAEWLLRKRLGLA